MDKSTIIVEDFNTLLATIDSKTRQKFSEDTERNNTINHQDLIISIYRTQHPTIAECTFLLTIHGTYTNTIPAISIN